MALWGELCLLPTARRGAVKSKYPVVQNVTDLVADLVQMMSYLYSHKEDRFEHR